MPKASSSEPPGSITYVEPVKCARKSCGRVRSWEETKFVKSKWLDGTQTGVCPHCGSDSFYYLNAQGKPKKRDEERAMQLVLPAPKPTKDELIAEMLAALKAFVRAHESWLEFGAPNQPGDPPFEDPLTDAHKLATKAIGHAEGRNNPR